MQRLADHVGSAPYARPVRRGEAERIQRSSQPARAPILSRVSQARRRSTTAACRDDHHRPTGCAGPAGRSGPFSQASPAPSGGDQRDKGGHHDGVGQGVQNSTPLTREVKVRCQERQRPLAGAKAGRGAVRTWTRTVSISMDPIGASSSQTRAAPRGRLRSERDRSAPRRATCAGAGQPSRARGRANHRPTPIS